jgi:hypothetical protein
MLLLKVLQDSRILLVVRREEATTLAPCFLVLCWGCDASLLRTSARQHAV